jgi:transcriptional regulator with XRE-family HTH domain
VSELEQLEIEQALLLLGRAIREVREQQGVSTRDLAAATGVARERIAALENGRFDPEYDLLIALAEGIGVRPSAFFVRAEELCRG